MKIVPILGVKFAKISLSKTVEKIKMMVEKGGRYQVMTLNPEYLVWIQEDQSLKQAVEKADLVVADGMGVILASWLIDLKARLGGHKTERLTFKERITGGELVEALAKLAGQEGWKIGLIGGEEGVAERALKRLKESRGQLRGLALRGSEEVRKESKKEHGKVVRLIAHERLQILFTSFGFYGPIWIEKTLRVLQRRGKSLVALEVGGVFNYLAGKSPQPPKFLRKIGWEWLWRLATEPWRWKRQLKLLKFVKLLFLESPKATSPRIF